MNGSSSSQDFEATSESSSSASPADCVFGIKLQMSVAPYTSPEGETPVRPQAWRMRIIVVEVNNIDPNIFVYTQGDPDAETGLRRKYFQSVASPTDLVEYPDSAPSGTSPQFFRLASIDMVDRKLTVLEAAWQAITEDVTLLIENAARLCELDVSETFTAGTLESTDSDSDGTSLPDAGSSAGDQECPVDLFGVVEIEASDDPIFPVGTVLADEGAPSLSLPADYPEECSRQWGVDSATPGYSLTLVTNLATNTVELTVTTPTGTVTAESGLSDDYRAVIYYSYGAGQDYSIEISGT